MVAKSAISPQIMTIVFSKVAVSVSAKVSTSFHSKVFGVTFEVSKFLSARTLELQLIDLKIFFNRVEKNLKFGLVNIIM